MYRDGMFRTLFNDREELIALYNALKGTNYGPETTITLNTLHNALYLDIKNDIAFTIANICIIFTEHQSTLCPNMPARMLQYFGRVLEKIMGDYVYRETLFHMPVPEFYVFYVIGIIIFDNSYYIKGVCRGRSPLPV